MNNAIIDIDTKAIVRQATQAEWEESVTAIGDTGAISVDGYAGTVYVDGEEYEGVTDDEIESLSCEAGEAGDAVMQAVCERALAGDVGARNACMVALINASAQTGA